MLDFSQVTNQIQAFTQERERALPRLQAALREAGDRLRASGETWAQTQEKIAQSRTSWLVAGWTEPPDVVYDAPVRPAVHTVLAADGSQIVSERHDICQCYLLNIGLIALRYGTGERATLTSRPSLDFPDDDLLNVSEGDQATIAGKRLALRRLLAEFAGLSDLMPTGVPTLALSDGTLILWMLETETEAFRMQTLDAFQKHLGMARTQGVPVVGYISQPQSRDVVNSLRVSVCPHDRADCDHHCPNPNKPRQPLSPPPCAYPDRIMDHELFASLLCPGQRSAVFRSQSKIFAAYRPENCVTFFYLHTGREVARIEMPAWVSDDPELLALTHALCWDQCCKGDGYPVALAEAHEQAVVRAAEKTAFFQMMQRAFVASGQPVSITQKALSKRARRV